MARSNLIESMNDVEARFVNDWLDCVQHRCDIHWPCDVALHRDIVVKAWCESDNELNHMMN